MDVNLDKTFGFDWIEFLNGKVGVAIRNAQDFSYFKKFLANHKIVSILSGGDGGSDGMSYTYWMDFAARKGVVANCLIFTYNNDSGLRVIPQHEYINMGFAVPLIANSLIHS